MFRRLLNIASIVCLVLCVAFMGMCVRSYWSTDSIDGNCFGRYDFVAASGHARFLVVAYEQQRGQTALSWRVKQGPVEACSEATTWFSFCVLSNPLTLSIPRWPVILLTGIIAALTWIRAPWRFTLRSLFIATTFLAVVLGMIAWLDRAWIGK
jgi:hypothetical protein